MTRRQLAYLAMTQAVMILAIGWGAFAYTNYVDHRRIAGERAAAAARVDESERTRQALCKIAIGQADAFATATSPIGVQAREGWLALAQQFRCT